MLPLRTRRSSGLDRGRRNSGDAVAAAFADLASGRIRAAEEDESAGIASPAALRGFTTLQLPLEAARAQRELARRSPDAPEAAVAEARLALRAFERIGATADADATAALLRSLALAGVHSPSTSAS